MKSAFLALIGAAGVAVVSAAPAHAHDRAIALYSLDGTSGDYPNGGVITDAQGTVFGTTSFGGTGSCSGGAGCGTVFALSPPSGGGSSWTLNVLYNFQGGQDGSSPSAQLTLGPNGSLYGYTTGGTYGTVFQLTPPVGGTGAWTFQILYVFSGGKDGNLEFVYSPLIRQGKALYGVASGGSNACGNQGLGCGSLFKLTPPKAGTTWNEKTLFRFSGGATSGTPTWIAGPDSQGAYYVSTSDGDGVDGNGAVVQLSSSLGVWNENVLTKFNGGNDGSFPGSLVLASDGTLYGIAAANKGGLAFQLTNNGAGWTRTNIVAIAHDRYGPNSLAAGANGTLIGTIEGDFDFFAGNVFQLTQSNGLWTYTQLWNFNRGPDRNPINVVTGRGGHLFGVLNGGDSGFGTLFKLR